MKKNRILRKRYLSLMLAVLLALAGNVFGQTAKAATATATANKTLSPITIDGNLNESVWSLNNSVSKATIGTPNNSVSFGTLWDNTYLYIGISAADSNLNNDSPNIYDDDSFDIYIDANHNKGTTYDSFDRQFQVGYNDGTLVEKNGNTSGVLHATSMISDGFSAELAIPWSSLGVTPSANMAIGLDIANNDDDNGGARDSQLVWNGTANNYYDTSAFGDLTLSGTTVGTASAAATANKTLSPMTIDGNLNESVWSLNNSVSKATIGTPNNTVSFGTLWDNTYLYVGIKATDGNLYNDSPNIYDDDSFDIYIDANHNKGTTYDSFDRQFQVGYNDGTLVEKNGNTSGVLQATSTISGGFSAELAIPWSSLGVTPSANMVIGLDIANNDDDNGGARDSQLVWSGTANNYYDTSAFGDLTLSGTTVGAANGTAAAYKTLSSMTIDGNLNESVWSLNNGVSKATIGTPNNTVSFGTLWDTTYLYVGVKATDINLYNDSPNIYDDDSFDIYIDANHNKGTTYDSFDRQFQVGYNDGTLVEKNGNSSGVLHATSTISGSFSAELAIPWSSLGVTPSANMVIGLDIANNDDDNGGARDSQAVWNGTANDYYDTSAFGDVALSGTTVGSSSETVGGGSLSTPAIGPAPTGSFSGFTLVKNWHFGTSGTIKSTSDLISEFQFHDQFNTIANGTNYGAVIVAPTADTALSSTPTGPQPVEDPSHPVRQFTDDSMKTFLVPLNGATSVSPSQHNVGNGSIQAKWKLPNGGSLLGHDVLWETRVRYVTPQAFWFALWNAGNQWNQGAEIDTVESFGYDNGGGNTNFDGRYWHSNSVGGADQIDYSNWGSGMAAGGVNSFDATQYHTWQLYYGKDNSYKMYVDGHLVQYGSNYNWTLGATAGGTPVDMDFLFDFGWGHTQIPSVNVTLPASTLAGKYYEINYSRVYMR